MGTHLDPGALPAATAAWLRLRTAVAVAAAGGVPCMTGDDWLSDIPEARAAATTRCAGCAVSCQRAQYADVSRQAFGVWAGRDRTVAAYRGAPR